MGLFDKMFGRGASESEQQQGAGQRFNELKQKYQSVLNLADQEHIQFYNLHIQDNKLRKRTQILHFQATSVPAAPQVNAYFT